MRIPLNASPKQRHALTQYRHFMLRELMSQEKTAVEQIAFFKKRNWDVSLLEEDLNLIRKTRKEYE